MNDPIPGVDEYAAALSSAKPSPFVQPSPVKQSRTPVQPMTPRAQEIAGRIRETFYSYSQRRTSDNRAAQIQLGPSEIGTPCDRRIAMSLAGVPRVNPGGDGWASFVGTCVHAGLAEMFQWASGNSGRYEVEMPLQFPSVLVPRGTGDLLDRTLLMFLDHKVMGRWSLDKLRTKGPSETYRIQVHCYAYSASLSGEDIKHVSIVGWPREGSSLDNLYVWEEPYKPSVARQALARVDTIMQRIDSGTPLSEFAIEDDCKFCPFHKPRSTSIERGCNGK